MHYYHPKTDPTKSIVMTLLFAGTDFLLFWNNYYVAGTILSVLIFSGIVYIFNETGFGYREKSDFKWSDPDDFFSPEVAPVEDHLNKKNEKVILFIHGFSTTPRIYKEALPQFREAGFDCVVPLLPGAGISIDSYIRSNFTQWYAAIRERYLELKKIYSEVYIVGSSLGGVIALGLGAEFSKSDLTPDAIVGVGIPAAITMGYPSMLFIRWISIFVKKIKPGVVLPSPSDSSDDDNDNNWCGYKGTFPRQLYSMKVGVREVGRKLSRLNCPLLLLHSKRDQTVPYHQALTLGQKVNSRDLRIRILDISQKKHSGHNLFLYHSSRDICVDASVEFFKKKS